MIGMTVNNRIEPAVAIGPETARYVSIGSRAYGIVEGAEIPYHAEVMNGGGTDFTLNGAPAPTPLTPSDARALVELMCEPNRNGRAWERPEFTAPPDPLGVDWTSEVASLPDRTAWLQSRLDAEGIVLLEPGRYAIASSLRLPAGGGIVGSGPDKTVIVAKDPHLVMLKAPVSGSAFVLGGLTMQGGGVGLLSDQPGVFITRTYLSHAVFRNMGVAGILLDSTYSWDNNHIDFVSFVACDSGILQRPDPNYTGGDTPTMTFMDKNFWYRCQFVDCRIALNLHAKRANNLNAYFECLFSGCREKVGDLHANSSTIFSSCIFKDNRGSPMVDNAKASFVNCSLACGEDNQSLLYRDSVVEGCVFDSASHTGGRVVAASGKTTDRLLFFNSDAGDLPMGTLQNALFVNSATVEASLNHAVVQVRAGTESVLSAMPPAPCPQLLFGTPFVYEAVPVLQRTGLLMLLR